MRFGVPESDARRLRLLAEMIGASHAFEVGTSPGWSGLWLCLGMESTQGQLTTYELSPAIAAAARENFRKAGLNGPVTVVVGDAHRNLINFEGPVDLVFLDADKEGYVGYLNRLLPLVRPGGLILVHNTRYSPEYLRRVTTDPMLDTLFLTQSPGLADMLSRNGK
ncbi:MAG: O-methyltransferase [Bryobacteraceae bacterium]